MDGINDKDMWDLQGGDYSMVDNTLLDVSECMWNGVGQNEEELLCMLEENTPLKACGDLPYYATSSEYLNKDLDLFRENSSQIKRRRMLQFDPEAFNAPLCNENMSTSFLQSEERMDSFEEALPDVSQWVSSFADTSASGYVPPDQSSWLTDCFGNADMQFNLEDMNLSGSSELQIDITEFCDTPVQHETAASATPQECITQARPKLVFKGKKSCVRPPTKVASSVVYPFAFVKPCGVHGDVTLKDINQRIRTPPPSKLKKNLEDPTAAYPTSALTGKPVVGKTKIRTEGGKGSITIMRTKG